MTYKRQLKQDRFVLNNDKKTKDVDNFIKYKEAKKDEKG